MQTSLKKEVSNRGMQGVIDSLIEKKFDMNTLLDGIPYDLSYLKDRQERIEWWVYCKIIANLRPYFTQKDFEGMNRHMISRGKYFEGVLFGFFFFGSNRLSRIFHKQIWKLGEFQFSNIKQKTEFLDKNKLKIFAILDEGYEFPVEFAYFTKGAWDEFAALVGRKGFKVEFSVSKRLITFIVSWDKEGFFFRISRVIRWFFNIKKALFEVTDTHAELLQRYDQLQESKSILEKQTRQLKTAYEISKSIKQTLHIKETLEILSGTLLKEAEFSAVIIELIKDMDDNDFEIKVRMGDPDESMLNVKRQLIASGKHIGYLTAFAGIQKDFHDMNELIDYITPLISIAVYNALVLRAIVDYRDNLENKVSQRTIELQTARDELVGTNELLKQAQIIQRNFFTNISHEFRTPLTLIIGPAKQLLSDCADEKSRRELELICRSAGSLNNLVDELLEISKIESGEMKLKTSLINLFAAVQEMVSSYWSLAERKKITFEVFSDEKEIFVYVDKDKLDRAFTNVLVNAFKFTPDGGKIEVKTLKDKDHAIISIKDTGMGIPANQVDKIFDRFYQVDSSHTRTYEGTGIGLSLTKELIELHKGRIEVESLEGKGSTFRLCFLLGKEHLIPEQIIEDLNVDEPENEKIKELSVSDSQIFSEKQSRIEIEPLPESGKPALLIIEDNPEVRRYIKSILKNQYKISEAADGEEGLNKSYKLIPDLIISDIMMPKMDGFKMCTRLKTDERTSHIPVIMLTAKATMKDKISGLELGADDYIMKPFEAEELKARIINLLEQRKRLQQHFRSYGLADIDEKQLLPVDQKFLQNAVDIISKHISDTSFSVEIFADRLNISRSLLFKKIEALFGEAPNELIRRIRLNKAARLIERNTGNISEIALEVGFNNPSYFAECFKKQFGVSPSHYKYNS